MFFFKIQAICLFNGFCSIVLCSLFSILFLTKVIPKDLSVERRASDGGTRGPPACGAHHSATSTSAPRSPQPFTELPKGTKRQADSGSRSWEAPEALRARDGQRLVFDVCFGVGSFGWWLFVGFFWDWKAGGFFLVDLWCTFMILDMVLEKNSLWLDMFDYVWVYSYTIRWFTVFVGT